MNKYLVVCLLSIQQIMMFSMEVTVRQLNNKGKKRESVSRVVTLKKIQPIFRTSSGEFLIRDQDTEPSAVIFSRSDSSLSDQGCSPRRECFLDGLT